MNKAYLVILAIGTAAFHDTGRRLEIPVMAASPLDAAVVAENTGNYGIVGDNEYVHALSVKPVRTGHTTFTPPSGLAVAV